MDSLVEILIVSSERASNIAKLLRQDESTFEKLVEQKSESEANPRFRQDFKTLADVVVQEMIKYHVGLKFPTLRERVRGEESNKFFCEKLNKTVEITIQDDQEATELMLSQVMDKNIAVLLAMEIHGELLIDAVDTKKINKIPSLDVSHLSIWIDPIDGTNEYVEGRRDCLKKHNIYLKGLKCVTVLIGAYNNEGNPVVGVINQPFFNKSLDAGFKCYWGICWGNDVILSSIDNLKCNETNIICIGSSESKTVIEALEQAGYTLLVCSGAGYKILTTILGLADAYVLSKPTTFVWDTCAPQAILRALGGNIVELESIKGKRIKPLAYNNEDSHCNVNGIVAYRNEKVIEKILSINLK